MKTIYYSYVFYFLSKVLLYMNKLFTPILILLLSGCSTHNRDTVFAEKAAEQGDAFASIKKAAEQGFATAQFNLGVMYGEGQGVLQDNKKALMWFHLARKNGSSDAYSMIKLLVPSMTYTYAQKALDASKICLESGYKKCG
ncbi:tetratricopeptide repeat protein [Vibrio diabolicus]|uniref:tetratricopeptide repeat protein n=1 Tax=Vibrio diabolicus TaxID=50719 RepID=UPI002285C612|nr:hypothetical protein [Vibrio diabolicus]MCZ0758150.1 hypothetical protein [Vibrio diabolicus]